MTRCPGLGCQLSGTYLTRVAWFDTLSKMALIALVTLGDKSEIINRFVSGRVLVGMGEGGWVGGGVMTEAVRGRVRLSAVEGRQGSGPGKWGVTLLMLQ